MSERIVATDGHSSTKTDGLRLRRMQMQFTDEQQRFIDEHYQLLPVDADGVPIHLGDVMEWSNGSFTVHELKLTEDGWQTWDSAHGYTVHADECIRHIKPDSWERIISDAVILGRQLEWFDNSKGDADSERELVERCKRLAGEDE